MHFIGSCLWSFCSWCRCCLVLVVSHLVLVVSRLVLVVSRLVFVVSHLVLVVSHLVLVVSSLVLVVSQIGFSIRVGIRSFFDPIHVVSTLGDLLVIHFFLSTSTSNLMLLITIVWSLATLTWLMTVTSVMMSGLFVNWSQFWGSLHCLGFSVFVSSLLSYETWYSWFCAFRMLHIMGFCRTKLLPVTRFGGHMDVNC